MRLLIVTIIFSIAVAGCFAQDEVQNTIYYYGGTEYYQQTSTYPDGSYRFKIVLYNHQREEEGFYNSNGVWTVRGKVSWLNPSETRKHTDIYQADDKGYQVKSSEEELPPKPAGAPPLSCALPSICG